MDQVSIVGYLIAIAIMAFIICILYTWVDTMASTHTADYKGIFE